MLLRITAIPLVLWFPHMLSLCWAGIPVINVGNSHLSRYSRNQKARLDKSNFWVMLYSVTYLNMLQYSRSAKLVFMMSKCFENWQCTQNLIWKLITKFNFSVLFLTIHQVDNKSCSISLFRLVILTVSFPIALPSRQRPCETWISGLLRHSWVLLKICCTRKQFWRWLE